MLKVRCWSDEYWGCTDAESEAVTVCADTVELKAGGWIYEIAVQWDITGGYGGKVFYFIYVKNERA